MHETRLDRRHLITSGAALFSALALGSPTTRAAARAFGREEDDREPRTLVLLELSGGNDSLSTIVPYADDAYHALRPTTGMPEGRVHRIDDYRAFHPRLRQLHGLYGKGKVAIVEGVGYPGPVRSHFKALDIWHTADRKGRLAGEGWIGRLCEAAWADAAHPELVVHIGRHAPYSLYSTTHPPVALESPEGYQWYGDETDRVAYAGLGTEGADAEAQKKRPEGREEVLARLRGVLDDARDSSVRIRRAAFEYKPVAAYPRSPLGEHLRDLSAVLHGGLGTRVLSASLGGFDTHATQKGQHDRLMGTVDDALGAFMEDLTYSEAGRNTIVLVYSEFGRRVRENASRGHDHGKAGVLFVLGHKVKGGLYGEHPSLTDLSEGDLAYTTDFRSVYGSIIEGWFGVEHEKVLGRRYAPIPLFG